MNYLLHVVKISLIMLATAASVNAYAHGRYILPTHTILSGEKAQQVTFSASISNDVFRHDMPLGDSGNGNVSGQLKEIFKRLNYVVIGPDGKKTSMDWHAYARQSIADLTLEKSGTYQIAIEQPALIMTTFKKEDGKRGRVFGDTQPPKNATDIAKREVSAKVVTYVSYNKPNKTALTPTGKGLELSGDSHPNDLFVNEEGHFQLLLNGEGASDIKLSITRAGTKHRNQREEVNIATNKDGTFNHKFSEAGFYLLEAKKEIKASPDAAIQTYHHSLYITLEVFPE